MNDKQSENTVTDAWSPKIGSPELVYENPYFQVSRVGADFGAFTKEYFVLDCGRRTGMLATRNGSLLLVQQYRLLIDGLYEGLASASPPIRDEFKAGLIEESQDEMKVLEDVAREVRDQFKSRLVSEVVLCE